MNDANRNLLRRILSAAVLLPPLLGAVFFRRAEPLAAIVLLVGLLAQAEFYRMALRGAPWWVHGVGLLLGLLAASALLWAPGTGVPVAVLGAAVILCASAQMISTDDLASATTRSASMFFGIVYVPVLLSYAAALKLLPHRGAEWVMLLLALVWLSDTGAYAVGRTLGRHQLSPRISPAKSWEGALGGLLGASGAVAGVKLCCHPDLSWLDVALIAVPGGVLAQLGDLVESMFKRGFGVKDSGTILPGHGGLLDRIDALLFAAPYVYLYARLIVHSRAG